MSCKHWDSGFCYSPLVHAGGQAWHECPGTDLCDVPEQEEVSPNIPRIDIIGSNGNDGEHYLVEQVARSICGDTQDQNMGKKSDSLPRWTIHIPQAIRVIELVRKHDGNL